MKRFLTLVISIFFILISFNEVLAQNVGSLAQPTESPIPLQQQNLEQLRERLQERMEERLQIREEERVTRAARFTERKRERIRLFFGRLTRRLEAAITRLERLISRIESRLDIIESGDEEIDTVAIREKVAEAKDKLVETETALGEAQDSLEGILEAENPKEACADVRELIKGIKQQLIEVHRILVHLIGDIRGLRIGQGEGE